MGPPRAHSGRAIEPVIRKLAIQSLKAQLILRQFLCAFLARELEIEGLTANQKAELAYRWDKTLKESQILQLTLDPLEWQESGGIAA